MLWYFELRISFDGTYIFERFPVFWKENPSTFIYLKVTFTFIFLIYDNVTTNVAELYVSLVYVLHPSVNLFTHIFVDQEYKKHNLFDWIVSNWSTVASRKTKPLLSFLRKNNQITASTVRFPNFFLWSASMFVLYF